MDAQDQQLIQMLSKHNGMRTKVYPGSELVFRSNAELGYCHFASSKSEPGPLEITEVNLLFPRWRSTHTERKVPCLRSHSGIKAESGSPGRWALDTGYMEVVLIWASSLSSHPALQPAGMSLQCPFNRTSQQTARSGCVCVCVCMNTGERPPLGSPHP